MKMIASTAIVGTAVAAPAAIPTAAPALLGQQQVSVASADSELLALADKYIIAERRYADSIVARDDLIDRNRKPPTEALRVRPRDLELGKKLFCPTDEFWHRPCDMGQWRDLVTYKIEYEDTDERQAIVSWKIPPSEELRARGAEIMAAYDAWLATNSGKKPRGYRKAEREARKAEREYWRLEQEVAETPATTIEGMLAKIRCAEAWEHEEGRLERIEGCAETMALSIFDDIRRMAKSAACA